VGAALSNDVGKPPTLDYATPQEGKNPFARVIFGILGVFAAVFGILVTFFGIYSLLCRRSFVIPLLSMVGIFVHVREAAAQG
jgi:hypothetical protein